MKVCLIILMLFVIKSNLFGQSFVISEYFNDKTPDLEWTEILVIKDMSNIVGYSLRDNSTNGDAWRPAIIFKDIPLWRNLRSGTVIVINHRDGNIDTDKSDGYIEVAASSSEYFDNSINSPDSKALNISASHDLIQLQDQDGNNVHTLAHMPISKSNLVFDAIIGAKVGTPHSAINSVRVYPGATISDYNGGLDNSLAITSDKGTKGHPNESETNSLFTNHIFWRQLREPTWINTPNLQSNITSDFKAIKLEWSPASKISDKNEGYLVVRFIDNGNQSIILNDGEIYKPGQKIGPYTIIDTLPDLTNSTYTDNFKVGTFNCGEKYSYRLYIYRYQQSAVNPEMHDNAPQKGRGRAYNETDYAASHKPVEKSIPPMPMLSTKEGKIKYCIGETANVVSDLQSLDKYSYDWYLDNIDLNNNNYILQATKQGKYTLIVTDKQSGCVDSNNIVLEFLLSPEAHIVNQENNLTFNKDTIIDICGTKQFNFFGKVISANNVEYFWLKDGVLISQSQSIIIDKSGKYVFVARNASYCSDTSIVIELRYNNPDFSLSPNTLSFDYDTTPIQSIKLSNLSDSTLIIAPNNITINPLTNFSIINPVITTLNPLIIPAKSDTIITVQFQSTDNNPKSAILNIKLCNVDKSVQLEGVRKNNKKSILLADPTLGIDFGDIISTCDTIYKKGLNLIVNGPKDIRANLQKLLKNIFTLSSSKFIIENEVLLLANSINEIVISIDPSLPIGTYYDEIIVIYKNVDLDNYDTLKIPITANIIEPQFLPDTIRYDFSHLPNCINQLDTSFNLNINPAYDFYIKDTINSNHIKINESLPKKLQLPLNNIKLHFDFSSTDTIQANLILQPCNKEIPIVVVPPQNELIISYKDTIDFGIINNFESCGDVVKDFIIDVSHPINISSIEYQKDTFLLEIADEMQLKEGRNILNAIFSYQKKNKYLDSIIFMIKECNKKIKVYCKGERSDSQFVDLSKKLIDFGTNSIGVNSTFKVNLYNFSQTQTVEIANINVPSPFIIINPNFSDFPKTLLPNDSLELEFGYNNNSLGINQDSISISIQKPCPFELKYIIIGNTIDKQNYDIRYNLPDKYDALFNQSFVLPLDISINDKLILKDTKIKKITLFFSYDKAIFDVNSIKQISTSLNMNEAKFTPGQFLLTYELNENSNLYNEVLSEINVKPLLGHSLSSKIYLDSVVYSPNAIINSQLDSTLINLNGDCIINYRTVEVGGTNGIILKSKNPMNTILDFDIEVVSDGLTEINLADIHGNLIKNMRLEKLNSGKYNIKFNLDNVSSGVYFIILNNGINSDIKSVIIQK
ncbi:MAG TPA: hypothetical protein PLE30_07015 [Candidatus Kapabacteria bacterium]|nr:hypothetical protein [Candidatus Kapabacteria bacterium]